MSVRVSFDIDEQLYEKIKTLAHDMERSLDEVFVFALEDLHDEERPIMDGILEGERDFEEGRTIPHEDVVAWMNSLYSEHPLPNPSLRFERKLAS